MVTITDEGLSYVQYEADGSAVNFALTFPYLLEEHVSVFKNGVLQTLTTNWSWLNASEIQMVVAPADGDLITIKRNTQNTERFVNFEDGGVLREATLDLDSNQLFYLSQEAIDTTNFNLAINSTDSTIDALSNKIINLANGTASSDAVNKGQLDAVQAIADAADTNADTALATANGLAASIATANANASAAVLAADAAQVTADAAVVTADAAEATASGLAANIATANSNADAAVITADAAEVVANAAQVDATQALADAATAQADIDAHELLTEAHGATGAVVGTTNTQTLTNKTITGADIRTPSRLDVKQDTRANLETYASTASNGQLCFATDLKKMYQVVDSVLKDVGGAGGLNYIEGGDAEGGKIGTEYKDAVSVAPEDGTGGSPTVTLTASAVSPLRGTKSFLFAKSAANLQGEGHGIPFTIDVADKASIQRISFDYSTTANYADGDMRIYVYDVTNSRLIEVVDRDLYATEFGKYSGSFQTSSDSVSYRLILHVADDSSLAWDVKIDNVVLGPQVLIKGLMGIDPQSYIPTIGGAGTPSSVQLEWSRTGAYVKVQGRFTTGTTTAVTATLDLPNLAVIGSASALNQIVVGRWTRSNANASNNKSGVILALAGNNFVTFSVDNYDQAINPIINQNGNSIWGTGDVVRVEFEVPILGWSSNMTLSEDAGNREIAFKNNAVNPTSSAFNGTANLIWSSALVDTTNSYNPATGVWTCPESGRYSISGSTIVGGTEAVNNLLEIRIYVGADVIKVGANTIQAAGLSYQQVSASTVYELSKGAEVYLRINTGITTPVITSGSQYHAFEVIKLSSPQTIGAGDVVACSYTTNTGSAVTNGNAIVYEDVVYDTHTAYNTSTGIFTAPQSGYYLCQAVVYTLSVVAALGNGLGISCGSSIGAYDICTNTTSRIYTASFSKVLYLSKGATATFSYSETLPVVNLNGSALQNHMAITKINGAS